MTEAKLKSLVTEAVRLDRQIVDLQEDLKTRKAALVVEAESRQDEHVETEGGGSSWVAAGLDGCIARVTFPAPTLKSKIDGEGTVIEKIRAAAGRFFDKLFLPAISYRPVESFRAEASTLLGRDASKVIKLCQSVSSPKVAFETKESAA